jgi:hypothetical protein
MLNKISLYSQKAEKFIFWPLTASLALIIFVNLFTAAVKGQEGAVSGGFQAGGRITIVSICTIPPALNPLCTAAQCASAPTDEVVILTPYGYSASQLCLSTAQLTSGPPVTVASIGNQILGLFSITFPIAVPLGLIGTSL